MATTQEDPAEAIKLLDWIQRLLSSSKTTSTYKFALLHALCDLSTTIAPDADRVPLALVAERFIELYWTHPRPFGEHGTLKQVTGGRSATALVLVNRWRRVNSARLESSRTSNRLPAYSREMLRVLRKDVLPRLQPKEAQLLYSWPSPDADLHFMPGVPQTLRRFHGLLTDMIQARWAEFVERANSSIKGSAALRDHLFGCERVPLGAVGDGLLDLQGGKCFYSNERLLPDTTEVDHFLPWSLTHNNSVGNLVLATKSVNIKKSDHLPTQKQRAKWALRNEDHAAFLADLAAKTGLQWQPKALLNLADWAFSQAS